MKLLALLSGFLFLCASPLFAQDANDIILQYVTLNGEQCGDSFGGSCTRFILQNGRPQPVPVNHAPETGLDGESGQPNGTLIYAFMGQPGATIEAFFEVEEEPGIVVVTGGSVSNYTYTEATNDDDPDTLQIDFKQSTLQGTELGADTFAIAIIPVNPESENFPVDEFLRGSWFSTDISPEAWQFFIPEEDEPTFGYEITATEGITGFFTLHLPNSLIAKISEFYPEAEISYEDLAIFNDGNQAAVNIAQDENGANIEVSLKFDPKSTVFEDDEEEAAARSLTRADGRGVSKELSVGKAYDLSLAQTKTVKKIKAGKKTTLYGWVKDYAGSDKVLLMSKATKAAAKQNGKKAFKKYKKKGFKRVTPDSDGYFEKKIRVTESDTFWAQYKSETDSYKSPKLKLKIK